MSELLNCPFCGGEAKRNDDKQNWGDVFCSNCGCHMAEGGMEKAIKAWNTRSGWVSVDERLPEPDVVVLAAYKNLHGKWRRIRAVYIPAKTRELHYDYDELEGVYDEESDTYYWEEGWYEAIDNWDEFAYITVSGGKVTHWMPLPTPPEGGE